MYWCALQNININSVNCILIKISTEVKLLDTKLMQPLTVISLQSETKTNYNFSESKKENTLILVKFQELKLKYTIQMF